MPPDARLDAFDNFPGFEKAAAYLKGLIEAQGLRRIADVGGGAHPLLDESYIRQHALEYVVIDISNDELDKAGAGYTKVCADITLPPARFLPLLGGRRFDLIFSHMLLEHIEQPEIAHRNLWLALRPGGIAVHFYPSPYNLPLALNRVLPEAISRLLVRVAQPNRDLEGQEGKFRAYYRDCGPPSNGLHSTWERLGYVVRDHTGYVGHPYYDRSELGARLERLARKALLRLGMPLTSACLLVLERPQEG
jgi:SAM-dependent methyltransferase